MSKALNLFKLALKFQKLAENPPEDEEATIPNKPKASELSPNVKSFYDEFTHLVSVSPMQFHNWLQKHGSMSIGPSNLLNLISLFNWNYFHKHGGGNLETHLDYKKSLDARIYTSPQKFSNLVQELMIPASDGIPKLWVYIGTFEAEKPIFDKELTHNMFVWEALSNIFGLKGFHEEIEQVQDFVHVNKNKIDKIRSFFSHRPKLLGKGSDGAAFDIGNFVLKIFYDDAAHDAARSAVERLHTQPSIAKTEAMIHDVGVLGQFGSYPIYYYIMEKMRPIGQDGELRLAVRFIIKQIVMALFSSTDIKDFKASFADTEKDVVARKIAEWSNTIAQSLSGLEEVSVVQSKISNLKKNWLASLVEEVAVKYLTDRTDLHVGNLGLSDHGRFGLEFRFFDPAHSLFTSTVNLGGGEHIN